MALLLGRGGREIFPKEGVVDVPYTFEIERDKIIRKKEKRACQRPVVSVEGVSQRSARNGTGAKVSTIGPATRAPARDEIFFFTYHHR